MFLKNKEEIDSFFVCLQDGETFKISVPRTNGVFWYVRQKCDLARRALIYTSDENNYYFESLESSTLRYLPIAQGSRLVFRPSTLAARKIEVGTLSANGYPKFVSPESPLYEGGELIYVYVWFSFDGEDGNVVYTTSRCGRSIILRIKRGTITNDGIFNASEDEWKRCPNENSRVI